MGAVKVLLRQIVAAGKADAPVHNGDFAVVAIVHKDVQNRDDRVEPAALDAAPRQLFDKFAVDKPDAAHVVVKYAHLHAMGGALGQNILQLLPGGGVLNGVVFHENKLFRAAQGCFLGLQRLAGVAVERHIGVVIGGVARAVLQIAGVVAGDAVRVGQGAALLQNGCVIPAQHRHICTKTAAHDADGPAAAKQQIDGQTEDGKQQNQNDPRNFIRGVDMQPIYTQRNQKCQHRRAYLNGGGVVVQLEGKPEDP